MIGKNIYLRDKYWKRHLKNIGVAWKDRHKFYGFQKQGKPCSCYMCSAYKYKRKRSAMLVKSLLDAKNIAIWSTDKHFRIRIHEEVGAT